MGRLSALFVAMCMVLIAGSIGTIVFLRFGFSGIGSTLVGVIVLIGAFIGPTIRKYTPRDRKSVV